MRASQVVPVVVGVLLIAAGVAVAATGRGAPTYDTIALALVSMVAVVALIGAVVKLAGTVGAEDTAAAAPWRDAGAVVDQAPERTDADHSLSGESFASVVEEAGEAARDGGTVADGLAVVRPRLRETLFGVLVQSGASRDDAKRQIERGEWTDDPVAAAALETGLDRPPRSTLDRVRAWLFPEQTLREEVGRTVRAIAATAEETLPTVPGQNAPREMPTVRPRLETLQRGADGQLQRARDPMLVDTDDEFDPTAVPEPDEESDAADDSDDGDAADDDANADDDLPTMDREPRSPDLALGGESDGGDR